MCTDGNLRVGIDEDLNKYLRKCYEIAWYAAQTRTSCSGSEMTREQKIMVILHMFCVFILFLHMYIYFLSCCVFLSLYYKIVLLEHILILMRQSFHFFHSNPEVNPIESY